MGNHDKTKHETREQRARKRRTKRIVKAAFWILIIGVAVWFFAFGNNSFSLSGVKDFFVETFNKSGADEVATLNGTSIRDVKMLDSDVLVVSDIGVLVMTKSGRESLAVQHGCTDPSVKAAGGRFIVFDRGGTNYSVYTKLGVQHEGVAPYTITDAAIAENGSFALVTSSKSYHNEVHYFAPDGTEKYTWYSADNYIYGIALKKNGKSMAALGMSTADGETTSYLFVFDPSKEEEPVKASLNDSIFYSVSYKGSDITVIGQKYVYTLDSKGTIQEWVGFDEMALEGYVNTDSETYLVLNKYGVGRDYVIKVINGSGKEKASAEKEMDFRDIRESSSGVTVLSSHDVTLYSTDLDVKKNIEISTESQYACSTGKYMFLFGVGSITKVEM